MFLVSLGSSIRMISVLDIFACVAALGLLHWIRSRRNSHLPPGPPNIPFIGNLHSVPVSQPWLKFIEWGRQYNSNLIRLNFLGHEIIVVNTLEAATNLCDKRSLIYNERPRMIMASDYVGMGWSLTLEPYGERWRDMRRAFHLEFGPKTVGKYQELHVQACHEFLRRLKTQPELFREDARHFAAQIIMRATYGIDIASHDDRYVYIAEKGAEGFSASGTGSYLVDYIPILRYLPTWFPGAAFKRQGRVWKRASDAMREVPFQFSKDHLASGDLKPCAAMSLLECFTAPNKNNDYKETVIKDTLGTVYAAGSETTVSTIASLFLAMVLYPHVQQRAQQEIDKVVGTDRLPSFADRDKLPYVDAILNECLRWHPVLPLNIPHGVTEDDTYDGYFIPKGSRIVVNNWAILHNESAYEAPHVFNPDRYLKEGQLNPCVQDPAIAAFGFGRRKCPGLLLAKDSVWIVIASVLSAFNIEPVKDSEGRDVIPEEMYCPGLLSHPAPFPCSITPRSFKYEHLISETNEGL